MNRLQDASDEMGLTISVGKTAAMSVNTEVEALLTAYGQQVPHCARFKYLGALFTADALGSEEFQTRLNIGYGKLAQLAPVFKRKDLSSHLKVRLVQSLVFPAVTYSCEAWSLNKDESAKLRSFETKSYRRAMSISYREHVSNQEVLRRGKTGAILESQVRRRKLQYFGHIVRHESTEKDIMLGMIPGMRAQGGQKKLWIDDITRWLTPGKGTKAMTVPQAVRLAQDRKKFRHIIHTAWHPVAADGILP